MKIGIRVDGRTVESSELGVSLVHQIEDVARHVVEARVAGLRCPTHDTSPPVAAALVDRLMHHGDVYYLKGESYRVRGKPRTAVLDAPPVDPLPIPVTDSMRENPDGASST